VKRIEKLRRKMKAEGIDGMLVRAYHTLRYLTGYSGSNGLLILTQDDALFLTDFRYKTQIEEELPEGLRRLVPQKDIFSVLPELDIVKNIKQLAFEEEYTPYSLYRRVKEMLNSCELVPVSGWVEQFSAIKEKEEIKLIKKAIEISEKALSEVLNGFCIGQTELELAAELEYQMKRLGGEKVAFDTIVVSGERGALVHGAPSDKKIKHGEFLTIDFGTFYRGYASDITRTFAVGELDDEQRDVYNVVRDAAYRAMDAARPGMKANELDAVARDYIREAGYGDYFGHGLGHGLGLLIHEEPRISQRVEEELKANMVFTVEPGIYIPGRFGVRIENDVLLTEDGAKKLTSFPDELLTIG